MGSKQEYIHNLARNVAGQIHLEALHFTAASPSLAREIYSVHSVDVYVLLSGWSSETVSKIALCLTPNGLKESFQDSVPLEQYGTVLTLFLNLAVAAVIEAMADNIRADAKAIAEQKKAVHYSEYRDEAIEFLNGGYKSLGHMTK